jgi:hypothetical protein
MTLVRCVMYKNQSCVAARCVYHKYFGLPSSFTPRRLYTGVCVSNVYILTSEFCVSLQ